MIAPIRFGFLTLLMTALILGCASRSPSNSRSHFLVLLTDFGTKDGAVSAMKGVAFQESPDLNISDLTHEVSPFDVWQASFRLQQAYKYWPTGTVFVTVVDPGVGSSRRSVVAKSKSGHYFVGPDNGILTHVNDDVGLESVRVLDENTMRRKGSEESYTFHGRDLYAYVGARLASGKLTFAESGVETKEPLLSLHFQKPQVFAQEGQIRGNIPVLDSNFGNVWTNIPKRLLLQQFPKAEQLEVVISKGKKVVFKGRLPLVETFARVKKGEGLLYFNSLLNLSLALNQESFARRYGIGSGPDWGLSVRAK